MKQEYYGWHWLNIEPSDEVYYYSHGKIHKQKILHATAYNKTIEFPTGKEETYLDYVIYEAQGKSGRKSTFRFDVGTSDMELGYGKDHNGNLRFSRIAATRHYFERKREDTWAKIRYYTFLTNKNKDINQKIDDPEYI